VPEVVAHVGEQRLRSTDAGGAIDTASATVKWVGCGRVPQRPEHQHLEANEQAPNALDSGMAVASRVKYAGPADAKPEEWAGRRA